MHFWSFFPGNKHDEKPQQLLFDSPSSYKLMILSILPWVSRFFNFSHDKTPNFMDFKEISFWNYMNVSSVEMFTAAEL